MRSILRVGIIVGGAAFVALFALQAAFALVVAAGVVLAGLCAGLGAAKWLERGWFGRQFAAGLRTGIIAAGMAGIGALLALLTQGPRSTGQLSAQSHIFTLDFAPIVRAVAFAGPAGADIIIILLATLLGIGLAAVVAQIGAWGKDRHAIQVIAQARLAAQTSLRGDAWAASSMPGAASGTQTTGAYAQLTVGSPSIPPISGPHPIQPPQSVAPGFALPDVPPVTQAPPSAARSARTGVQPVHPAPATPLGKQKLVPQQDPDEFKPTEPAMPAISAQSNQPAQDSKGHRTPRKPSDARSANSQLTDAMREALATWAADNAAANQADQNNQEQQENANDAAPNPQKRTPQPSAYLNSTPPVPPKRARKKQNTDWLC